jgi:hypothetical protein
MIADGVMLFVADLLRPVCLNDNFIARKLEAIRVNDHLRDLLVDQHRGLRDSTREERLVFLKLLNYGKCDPSVTIVPNKPKDRLGYR